MSTRFRTALRRSLKALDNEELRAASTPRVWVGLSSFVVLLLILSATFAPLRDLLRLDVVRAGLAFLIPLAFALAVFWVRRRDGARFSTVQGWLLLSGCTGVQFFAAALMTLSKPPGAYLFGAYFLVTTLTHGRQGRVTAGKPLLAVGTVVAVVGAGLLGGLAQHWIPLAVIGVGGLVCEFTMGEMADAQDRVLQETSQLRAAVHAQLLRQQERDVDRLNDAVVGMIHRNGGLLDALHEASSAAELLAGMEHRRGPAFSETIGQLRDHLARMEQIAGEISEEGRRSAGGDPEPVELLPIVGLVCEGLGYLFPAVKFEQRLDVPPETTVLVCGGATSLRRILENALVNACEGDGLRGANRVMLRCEVERSGRLLLEVQDDGPGFATAILAEPLEVLATTKERSSGLGLYTVECLLRAGGGTLSRINAATGGAVLRAQLPLAIDRGEQLSIAGVE
jgi:signal transduction histidine kinase